MLNNSKTTRLDFDSVFQKNYMVNKLHSHWKTRSLSRHGTLLKYYKKNHEFKTIFITFPKIRNKINSLLKEKGGWACLANHPAAVYALLIILSYFRTLKYLSYNNVYRSNNYYSVIVTKI